MNEQIVAELIFGGAFLGISIGAVIGYLAYRTGRDKGYFEGYMKGFGNAWSKARKHGIKCFRTDIGESAVPEPWEAQ